MLNADPESLDKPLEESVFSFLDVETTGLSPRSARVCEVAAVSFRGAERLGTLAELVNPGGPIPPACSAVHGITDEMVKDSPSFGAVAPRLLAMLENTVLVGHNADFDIRFLRAEFERVGLKFPVLPVVDTLAIARKSWKFQSNRLGNIAAELNISGGGWHRALADVETTRKVFDHFVGAMKSAGAVTVGELWKRSGGKTS